MLWKGAQWTSAAGWLPLSNENSGWAIQDPRGNQTSWPPPPRLTHSIRLRAKLLYSSTRMWVIWEVKTTRFPETGSALISRGYGRRTVSKL